MSLYERDKICKDWPSIFADIFVLFTITCISSAVRRMSSALKKLKLKLAISVYVFFLVKFKLRLDKYINLNVLLPIALRFHWIDVILFDIHVWSSGLGNSGKKQKVPQLLTCIATSHWFLVFFFKINIIIFFINHKTV